MMKILHKFIEIYVKLGFKAIIGSSEGKILIINTINTVSQNKLTAIENQ